MSYLEFDQVSFGYGKEHGQKEILKAFSLQVEKGEFVVIIGPSGCGKSTLLSLIEGLNKPDEGRIKIEDEEVKGPSPIKSIIFQHYSLFPWMTVEKNVRFGIRQSKRGIRKAEEKRLAYEALCQVGMENDLKKYPFELSGGMQQRTAIARTLAMDSELLLMDEPFGAVDPKRRSDLQKLLVSVWQKEKEAGKAKTIVFVTHDIDEAIYMADRIIFLKGDGSHQEFRVPLKRPRRPEELTGSQCFCSFRKELVRLFAGEEEE